MACRLLGVNGMYRRFFFSADVEPRPDLEGKRKPLASHCIDGIGSSTEAQDLLRRFNPRLVGFGIVGPPPIHFSEVSEFTGANQREKIVSRDRQEAE
jgi:hypothetical protein